MAKKETGIALRPAYWANVSGGKDSLYMLNLILHNLDKYPLDGVCHFELEIDYPFIHDVIDYMEAECTKHGIRFVRFKPRKTWEEWYYTEKKLRGGGTGIWGFPSRKVRWCNTYKMDGQKQLNEWMKSLGYYVVAYIGYCADEEKRFAKRVSRQKVERYPLVEEGIREDTILQWAQTQPIFNHYYETQRRCGCMYCPCISYMNYAYLYKHYPENFWYMIEKARETETILAERYGRPIAILRGDAKYNADYVVHIVETKWLPILNQREAEWEQRRRDAEAGYADLDKADTHGEDAGNAANAESGDA